MKLQNDLQFHAALGKKSVVLVTTTSFPCGQVNLWHAFCWVSLWKLQILPKLPMKHQTCLLLLSSV